MMINSMNNIIEEVAMDMKEFRRHLHRNPEPAFEESQTSNAIAEKLESIPQIEIKRGIGKTGIAAVLGREISGPCVALRADMDCLRIQEENSFAHVSQNKGLMHACGHDGHIACLVGAALVLGQIQEHLPGPVKFIFQPAEENFGGAKDMVEEGVLENPKPSVIFGLHGTPSLSLGQIGLCSGAAMAASKYFRIIIKGKGTHAAMPHKGVDAVLVGSHIVCAVQSIVARNIDPLKAGLISIPQFNGSTAPNVIPAEVTLEGTLRALSNETKDYLETRLTQLVHHTAEAFGATATIDFFGGYPLLENDREWAGFVKEIGVSELGKENVRTDYPPSLGAEDFAFYLGKIPGLFWWLGLGSKHGEYVPLHNPNFDFNDDAIKLGVAIHCRLALNAHQILS